jgi:transposase
MPTVCGTDVSKEALDVRMVSERASGFKRFTNDIAGFSELLAWGRKLEVVIYALEATGTYHKALVSYLHSAGCKVIVHNPYRIRQLAIGLGILNKDDKVDAGVLARAALLSLGKASCPVSEIRQEAQEVSRRIDQLKHQLAKERTRLKEPRVSTRVGASLRREIEHLRGEIQTLEREWLEVVGADQQLKEVYRLILSVPNVGPITARIMVSELPLESLESKRKAIGLAGLAPKRRRSGTSLNAPDALPFAFVRTLKKALYMPAIQALRRNAELRDFYMRLIAKGKHPKQGIVAVMRKIFARILAVVQRGTEWQETPLTS